MINNFISGFSAVFALLSVLITYIIFRSTRNDTSYSEIDKQYGDLLKLGMDDPDLRDYKKTSMFNGLDGQDHFKKKYNIYAYICWNFLETIYDRQKDKKGRFQGPGTWSPVLYEENRLHYTWFKENINLFKSDFQKFVTSDLNDINIVEGSIDDLKDVYERLKVDFADNELKDYDHLKLLLMKKKYKLLLAKHKVFKGIVGYAFIFEPENLKVLWIDYMAIDKKYRGAGFGTLFFNKIAESKQEGILGIFLEVEIPDETDGQQRTNQFRRINFYERMGAQELNIKYELPTDEGGFPMYLYFWPSPDVQVLPKELTKETIASAFEDIHSDIGKRDPILMKLLTSVGDEYFNFSKKSKPS